MQTHGATCRHLRLPLVAALALSACGPGEPAVPTKTAIELVQHTTVHTWQAHYFFPRPVRQVSFPRNAVLYRAALWTLTDEDFEIVRIPGRDPEGNISDEYAAREAIRRHDGRPFTEFSVTIPAVYDTWPKEYPQNYAFTDGSVLFYTGHLVVELDDGEESAHTLIVVPHDNQHVIVRGYRYAMETAVADPGDDGVFVYFGNINPIANEHFLAVIDPGLPGWLRDVLITHLPIVFTYYADRFGEALPRKPTVYFNFMPGDYETIHFKGGALGDATFALSVVGDTWGDPPDDLRRAVPLHVAHEAVHLWNHHLGSGERAGSWMHEGNADVLTWLALRESGYLDNANVEELVCDAFRDCVHKLGSRTLAAAETAGDLHLSYSCGAVIAVATDKAMRDSAAGDLFDFSAELMRRSRADRPNTAARYQALVTELTGAVVGPAGDAYIAADFARLSDCETSQIQ